MGLAEPIGYQAIMSWAELCGEEPERWEIAALEMIDDAYLAELRAARGEPQGPEMTTVLFDTMFGD